MALRVLCQLKTANLQVCRAEPRGDGDLRKASVIMLSKNILSLGEAFVQ